MFEALAAEADRFEGQHRMVKQLIKVVNPTVAHIEAKKRPADSPSSGSSRRPAESIVEEAGSGVVIERNNRFYVITNFHVIEGSSLDDIKVEVAGKYHTPIRLLHDRDTDLSVMSLSGSDLIPARLGDSSYLEIGDFVVAVGSPFGLSHSVSFGIVSALERHDLELGPKGVRYQDFIQTDAAINPGNSGGPLINLRGEIVGINTAIASNGGGSDGIGFAIPINMAKRIVYDLIDHGEVRRGFLGVTLDAKYNYQRAKTLGLDAAYGALVTAVTPNSPAAEAGVQVGDVILEFDNLRVANDSHLVTRVSLATLDAKVPLKIFRGGQYRTVLVDVKNRKDVDWRVP
jgi:serine protease Do